MVCPLCLFCLHWGHSVGCNVCLLSSLIIRRVMTESTPPGLAQGHASALGPVPHGPQPLPGHCGRGSGGGWPCAVCPFVSQDYEDSEDYGDWEADDWKPSTHRQVPPLRTSPPEVAATTWVPMGPSTPVLPPNGHPTPSQGRQKRFEKGQNLQKSQMPPKSGNFGAFGGPIARVTWAHRPLRGPPPSGLGQGQGHGRAPWGRVPLFIGCIGALRWRWGTPPPRGLLRIIKNQGGGTPPPTPPPPSPDQSDHSGKKRNLQ